MRPTSSTSRKSRGKTSQVTALQATVKSENNNTSTNEKEVDSHVTIEQQQGDDEEVTVTHCESTEAIPTSDPCIKLGEVSVCINYQQLNHLPLSLFVGIKWVSYNHSLQ